MQDGLPVHVMVPFVAQAMDVSLLLLHACTYAQLCGLMSLVMGLRQGIREAEAKNGAAAAAAAASSSG